MLTKQIIKTNMYMKGTCIINNIFCQQLYCNNHNCFKYFLCIPYIYGVLFCFCYNTLGWCWHMHTFLKGTVQLFIFSLTWIRINVIIHDIAFRKLFTLQAHILIFIFFVKIIHFVNVYLELYAFEALFYWSLFLVCIYLIMILFCTFIELYYLLTQYLCICDSCAFIIYLMLIFQVFVLSWVSNMANHSIFYIIYIFSIPSLPFG